MKLRSYKILTFDVYGTLIDWESGMVNALKPLTDKLPDPLSRDQILEAHAFHATCVALRASQLCVSSLGLAAGWTPARMR